MISFVCGHHCQTTHILELHLKVVMERNKPITFNRLQTGGKKKNRKKSTAVINILLVPKKMRSGNHLYDLNY